MSKYIYLSSKKETNDEKKTTKENRRGRKEAQEVKICFVCSHSTSQVELHAVMNGVEEHKVMGNALQYLLHLLISRGREVSWILQLHKRVLKGNGSQFVPE